MKRKRSSEALEEGESSKEGDSSSGIEHLLNDLHQDDSKMAIFAKYTPFMLGMVGGPSIEPDPLGDYIDQRIAILEKYIAMCHKVEGAIVHVQRSTISDLVLALQEEIQMLKDLYEEFNVKWVIKERHGSVVEEHIHVLETVEQYYEKGPVTGAAVALCFILSSLRLFAHLGNVMRENLGEGLDNHLYKNWIKYYSSQGDKGLIGQVETLLQELCSQSPEDVGFRRIYSESLMLELKLIYAQVAQPNSVSLLRNSFDQGKGFDIYCEFSGVCVKENANEKLLTTALKRADKHSRGEYRDKQLALHNQRLFILEKLLPKRQDVEVDLQRMDYIMERLIKAQDPDPYFPCKFLKGMHLKEIKKEATELQFRDGCVEFFNMVAEKKGSGLHIHIISDVFSEDIIKSAFSTVAGPQNFLIHSNILKFNDDIATGFLNRNITNPRDKHAVLKRIRGEDAENRLSVFVGNSIDDFLCLMEANIGIVIDPPDRIFETNAKVCGVSFLPLYQGVVEKQRMDIQVGEINNLDDFRKLTLVWKPHSGVLYTASNWADVQACLVGI